MKARVFAILALNSFQAMLKVFLVCAVGFFGAKYPRNKPLLSKPALQYISRLSTVIFIPCLSLSSLGSSLNLSIFKHIGFLTLCYPLGTLVSYALSETIGRLFVDKGTDPAMMTAMSVAVCFSNTISLPIMIMQTLCEESIVNADYNSDARECNNAVSGMIFLYGAGFHALYWSTGVRRLRSISSPNDESNNNSVCSLAFLKQVFLTPAILGVCAGLIIGLISPLRYYLFDSLTVFHTLGSAIQTLGQPVVAIQSLVMAASLGHVDLSPTRPQNIDSSTGSVEMAKTTYTTLSQDDSSTAQEQQTGLNPMTDLELNDNSSNNECRDKQSSAVTINSNHIKDSTPLEVQLPGARTIFSMTLCRCILTPAVMIPIIMGATAIGIVPKDMKLLQLMLCVQSGTTSAQVIIVSLNELGNSELASRLAYAYLYQYLFSFITITLCSTVAMSLIYENVG